MLIIKHKPFFALTILKCPSSIWQSFVSAGMALPFSLRRKNCTLAHQVGQQRHCFENLGAETRPLFVSCLPIHFRFVPISSRSGTRKHEARHNVVLYTLAA